MKSILYDTDKTVNEGRKFGASPFYYNATFVFHDGRRAVLRFTEAQVQDALDRGAHDPDGAIPTPKRWWQRFFW